MEDVERTLLETFPFLMHKLMHDFPFHDGGYGLNKTQQKTLHYINYHKTAHMGRICGHLNMEKGSFTTVVDALIDKGLIRRERDVSDRRKILLTMTAEGNRFVSKFEKKIREHIRGKLKTLTDEDKERFYRAVTDLNEIVAKL